MNPLLRARILYSILAPFLHLRNLPGLMYIGSKLKGAQAMLKPGDVFPYSRINTEKGAVNLQGSDYAVFYFYPKDDTPGCTIEANEFQKLKPEFDAAKIRILGVSVDDAASHRAFCEKFSLTFELATDPEGRVGTELGIMSGKVHKRVTFVVDAAGKVALVYPEVKPAGHARQILDDVSALRA